MGRVLKGSIEIHVAVDVAKSGPAYSHEWSYISGGPLESYTEHQLTYLSHGYNILLMTCVNSGSKAFT